MKKKGDGNMIDITNFSTTPHPTKAIFQRHKIQLAAISKAVGLSYGYLSNILSGNQPATSEVDSKLHELAASLEEGDK